MPLLIWRLSTLLLASLSMALSFCHVMELPVRLRWEPALWMQVTNFGNLYYLFGRVGAAIDVLAILFACGLAILARGQGAARHWTVAGAVLLAAGLALWLAAVAPMNAVMATWTPGPPPADFAAVRERWEYGHAAIAVVKIAGLTALLVSVLVGRRPGRIRWSGAAAA